MDASEIDGLDVQVGAGLLVLRIELGDVVGLLHNADRKPAT